MAQHMKISHAAILLAWVAAAPLSLLGQSALDYTQLTSLWRLNGNTADGVGPNSGTFIGSANYSEGPVTDSSSAVFDGASYVKAGKRIAFETNSTFTVTAWVKAAAQNSVIAGRMMQGGAYTGWEFHAGDRPGVLNVWLINQFGNNFIAVYGMTPVLDESWHHVAFTYDGSSSAYGVKIYVDGQDDTGDVGADSLTSTMLAANAEFNLGSRQNGANHNLKGNLAEVSLWKTVLNQEQIQSLYQNGIHPAVTFDTSAGEVFAGEPATLSWEAEPGATIAIDSGVGDVTAITSDGKGSIKVTPEVETIYTLTAKKGTSTQTKKVTIGIKPMIVQFVSSGNQLSQGMAATLSWIAHPKAQLTLTPALGDMASYTTNGVGAMDVKPAQTTQYVLKAQRGTNSSEASLNLVIIEPAQPNFAALAGLWRFNGDTSDSAGTNNGVFTGAQEQYLDGPKTGMQAIYFDGVSYVAAGQGLAFDTATPFSAAAWVNGPLTQDSTIVGRMRQGSSFTGWELHVGTPAGGSSAGKLNVWLINSFGSSYIQVNSPKIAMDDSWHHVGFTYDGRSAAAGVKIFVDGLDATGPATADNLNATILADDAELNMGSRQNGAAHFFQGNMSEVSVWSTALTPQNMLYLYNQGIPAILPPAEIRLSNIKYTVPATLGFSWTSVAGKTYRVETSSDLIKWTALADNYPTGGATGTTTTFVDSSATKTALFYRVTQK